MEEKENVYGEFNGTEQGMKEVGGDGTGRAPEKEKSSAVPMKFKDVDALARAYNSLQAEFTRRSQRLKELEKLVENPKAEEEQDEGLPTAAEKLRKTAKSVKAEGEKFDRFVSELEGGVRLDSENSEAGPTETVPENTSGAHFEEQAFVEGDEKPFSAGNTMPVATSREREELSAEELYQRASRDESVRLKIIGEYLASVGKTGAPLTRGGGSVTLTPPMKAKSIEDAGSMALRWMQKAKQ